MARRAEAPARIRPSHLAEADLEEILATSALRWGAEARHRYAALLAAAIRRVAADPHGPPTRERNDILPGIRSFHIRDARSQNPAGSVRRPVHILYYRAMVPRLVEIVRVLHERMEPAHHMES